MAATPVSLSPGHITQGVVPGTSIQDPGVITLIASTPTALNGGNTPTLLALQGVTVQAATGNTGVVRVGGSNIDATHGAELTAGMSVTYQVCDPATVFCWSSSSGQKVNCQWL